MKNFTNQNTLFLKILLVGLIFMASVSAFGQISLERTVVGTAGEEIQSGGIIINYTLGETAVLTHFEEGKYISEGFQQGDILVTSIGEDLDKFKVEIFPNPTTDFINIRLGEPGDFSISLYDIVGKLIIEEDIIMETSKQWSLAHLAQGTYLLKVTSSQNNQSQSYKIQKF